MLTASTFSNYGYIAHDLNSVVILKTFLFNILNILLYSSKLNHSSWLLGYFRHRKYATFLLLFSLKVDTFEYYMFLNLIYHKKGCVLIPGLFNAYKHIS
jgi:hypothetical protein